MVSEKGWFKFFKQIENQTVDSLGGVSADFQEKINTKSVVIFGDHEWPVLISKKITEPICSDFVFSFLISADFQDNFR